MHRHQHAHGSRRRARHGSNEQQDVWLSSETGVAADFMRADVYDWLKSTAHSDRRFDVVFSSYGVVCWLSDCWAWARGVAAVLRAGGRFVLVDFHPAAEMFDKSWNHSGSYPFGEKPRLLEEGFGDYVGESGGGLTPAGFVEGVRNFENPHRCHLFRWGLGEVVTALAGAGLRITILKEYPYSNGEHHFVGMRELPGRLMVPPEEMPAVPLMYGRHFLHEKLVVARAHSQPRERTRGSGAGPTARCQGPREPSPSARCRRASCYSEN